MGIPIGVGIGVCVGTAVDVGRAVAVGSATGSGDEGGGVEHPKITNVTISAGTTQYGFGMVLAGPF